MSTKIEKMDLHASVSFCGGGGGGSIQGHYSGPDDFYFRFQYPIYSWKKADGNGASAAASVTGHSGQELHEKK